MRFHTSCSIDRQREQNSLPRWARFEGAARGCAAEGRATTRRAAAAARTAGRARAREKAERVAIVGSSVELVELRAREAAREAREDKWFTAGEERKEKHFFIQIFSRPDPVSLPWFFKSRRRDDDVFLAIISCCCCCLSSRLLGRRPLGRELQRASTALDGDGVCSIVASPAFFDSSPVLPVVAPLPSSAARPMQGRRHARRHAGPGGAQGRDGRPRGAEAGRGDVGGDGERKGAKALRGAEGKASEACRQLSCRGTGKKKGSEEKKGAGIAGSNALYPNAPPLSPSNPHRLRSPPLLLPFFSPRHRKKKKKKNYL